MAVKNFDELDSTELKNQRLALEKQFDLREKDRQQKAKQDMNNRLTNLNGLYEQGKTLLAEQKKAKDLMNRYAGTPEYDQYKESYDNIKAQYAAKYNEWKQSKTEYDNAKAQYKAEADNYKANKSTAISMLNEGWDGKSAITFPEMQASDDSDNTTGSGNSDSSNGSGSNGSNGSNGSGSNGSGSNGSGSNGSGSNGSGSNIPGPVHNAASMVGGTLGRELNASIRGQPHGNLYDVEKDTHANVARDLKNSSARRDMEAQQNQQIANRNEYGEAGKIASVKNDAENRQNIQNKEGLSGSAAALERKTNAPDVEQQQQRQDERRDVAATQRTKADTDKQQSDYAMGTSRQAALLSRDIDNGIDTTNYLSKGGGTGSSADTGNTGNTNTGNTNTGTDNTGTQDTEPKPQDDAQVSGNPQNVLNYVTYGDEMPLTDDNDRALWKSWGSPTPLSPEERQGKRSGELQTIVENTRPEFWQKYANSNLGKTRNLDDPSKQQLDIGSGLTRDQLTNASEPVKNPPSDARVKNIEGDASEDLVQCLSDLKMKYIKEDMDRDGVPSKEDFLWLLKKAGPMRYNDRDWDALNEGEDDYSDESVLKAYADHIRNYVYTYKPEARQVDSRIDPDEEHIGPMAQDIEQVNPACVNETPEGIKTVDTARLAMMNAGAIGDLARRMQELEDKLKSLGL